MLPRWLRVATGAFIVVVVAAVAFAVFEPIQVLPRIGLAPGYSLVDQDGAVVTSESARGRLTLYTFAPTDCSEDCDPINATMAEVASRVETEIDLGSTELQLVTVALDDDPSSQALRAAAAAAGADGHRWRWVGGEPDEIRTIVGRGFGQFYEASADGSGIRYDPALVLVDGNGVVRGEYRYRTIANDADKLVHHIDILATEIRHAGGPTAVAYEAAHLFLCYP